MRMHAVKNWVRAAAGAAGLMGVAVTSMAEVLDDFNGSAINEATWEILGDKTYTVAGGRLTWNADSGNWGKGEIASQRAYFLPPAGETSTVSWVIGPASISSGTTARVQIGLVSDNETAATREHWANSTGGIWLDINGIQAADTTQAGVNTHAANDTKAYGGDASYIADVYNAPWNWQTETTTFRVDLTSTTFTWYHNGDLMGTYAWADWGIDTEFANGFHVWIMSCNVDTARHVASLDRIEFDNPVTGAGLITSFRAEPANVVGGAPALLVFEVDPAAAVDIQPDIGAVAHTNGIGQVELSTPVVDATTTLVYTLTATVGAEQETRETSVTLFPVPTLPLAEFDEEFEGSALNTALWDTLGDKTLIVTNGLLSIQDNGGNWGHGQVASVATYRIPMVGEYTEITFFLGPASITTDLGAALQSIRYQVGIVSGDQSAGWSYEHYQNDTGGTWLDLTEIMSGTTNSISGQIYYANDTKAAGSNATGLQGVFLDNWDWQNVGRAITLWLTDTGFTWMDGTTVLAAMSWDDAGLDTEFLSGYRIMAAGMNYDAGRGFLSYESIHAFSVSGQFALTGIEKTAGGVEVAWEVTPGATYTVQRAASLDGPWTPLAVDLSAETNQYEDAEAPGGPAFYQVLKTPPEPLLETGFEADEDLFGWTVVAYLGEPMWEVGTPTAVGGPEAAHSGTQVYGTVLDGNYALESEAALRSPVIDLTGLTQASLRFYQWYWLENGFDYGYVYLYDEAGTQIGPALGTYTGDSGGWQLSVVPLPAEAMGQRVYLEFRLDSDVVQTDFGWYLDDLVVE